MFSTFCSFLNGTYSWFIHIKDLSLDKLVYLHNQQRSVELFFHCIVIERIDTADAHTFCFP